MGFVLGASGLPCKSRDYRFYDIERLMPPDCYRVAALRLLRDANQLMGCNPPRQGTAYHLYGLAAECALKSVLDARGLPHGDIRAYGHDLRRLFFEVSRNQNGRLPALLMDMPKWYDWSETSRYWSDKELDRRNAEGLGRVTQDLFGQLHLSP